MKDKRPVIFKGKKKTQHLSNVIFNCGQINIFILVFEITTKILYLSINNKKQAYSI